MEKILGMHEKGKEKGLLDGDSQNEAKEEHFRSAESVERQKGKEENRKEDWKTALKNTSRK